MATLYVAEFIELAGTQHGDSIPSVAVPPDNEQTVAIAAALTAPVQSAPATATTGGTIPAATYFIKVTATNANGETLPSNEQSQVTTGTTSTLTVNWGAVTGATGYNIYIGTAAGVENVVTSVGTVVTTTLTALPVTSGTPPASNTTANSVALKPTTKWVELSADSVCSVAFGTGVQATTSNCRIAANERILRRVNQPAVPVQRDPSGRLTIVQTGTFRVSVVTNT